MNQKEYNKKYYAENREAILEYRNSIAKEKLKQNPNYYKDLYEKYEKNSKKKYQDKKHLGEVLKKELQK